MTDRFMYKDCPTDCREYSRLEMTTVLRTFSDDGIFGPAC
jgi:hypothetical protein